MFEGMGRLTMEVPGHDVSRQLDPVLNEDAFKHISVPLERWWGMPVYVQDRLLRNSSGQNERKQTRLTRKEIILAAANKEAVAHVDEKLEPNYERLAASGALGMYMDQIPLGDGTVVNLPPLGTRTLFACARWGTKSSTASTCGGCWSFLERGYASATSTCGTSSVQSQTVKARACA